MNSEADEEVFKEYKQLGPKSRSLEHYVVMFFHLVAAFVISVIQLDAGLTAWFQGFGVLTPILLITSGVAYSYFENEFGILQ